MRRLGFLLPVVLAAACATTPGEAPPEAPSRWTAALEPRDAAFADVTATATAVRTAGSTSVQIDVRGAEPGAEHPWHVHEGTCESGGPIVGDPARYQPVRIGAAGRALANAVLDVEIEGGRPYHVNVHRSAAALATVIACGDLREA
jgi:hypothetical protein